ncbi:hypothetical protein [Candidatus Uabimicrobium sp. HlEnr_7]|uniref:hypothetical protein n=1 Tax=Candidatus Uabimicrobium helgolandensis TaxID=3095367 RepID=UPI0035564D99
MEDVKKKRWKKVFVYLSISILSLLCISFILFCIFIANPFESAYNKNLVSLLPIESDSIAYIHDAKQLWSDVKDRFPFSEIKKTLAFRQFARTKEYRLLKTAWKNAEKQQQQIDFQFLQEKYLWKLIKGEIATSIRFKENKLHFLSVARVDFLMRIAEGIAPYVIPDHMSQKHVVNSVIKEIHLDKKNTLFIAFQSDVLFVSNNKDYLQESWRLVNKKNSSILSQSTTLKNRAHNKKTPLLLYSDNETLKKYISSKIVHKIQPLVDLKNIGHTLVSIKMQPNIVIEGITKINSISQYHEKIYQISPHLFRDEILPKKVYLKTQVPINIDIWEKLYLLLPRKIRKEADRRIRLLNRSHRTASFVEDYIFKHIDQHLILTSSSIDYVKQDIDVFDPYPALCVFAPSSTAQEFYNYLKEMLQREVAKTKGKVKVFEDKYGNHTFLRIDIGNFDITGGAVQPILTIFDNYIVFCSHISFFKDLVDIKDKIAPDWRQSNLYTFSKEVQSLSPLIKVEVASSGIIKYIEDFQELWAEEKALAISIRNPNGRKMEHIKAQLLRIWKKYLNYARSFKINLSAEIETASDEIQWNTALEIDFVY